MEIIAKGDPKEFAEMLREIQAIGNQDSTEEWKEFFLTPSHLKRCIDELLDERLGLRPIIIRSHSHELKMMPRHHECSVEVEGSEYASRVETGEIEELPSEDSPCNPVANSGERF